MNRFSPRLAAGLCSVLLVVVGCTGAPGAGVPTIGPGLPGDIAGTAQEQLCNAQNPAGLAMLAGALEAVDENTDMTQLNTSVNAAQTNLAQVEGDAQTETLISAAASAAQAFQAALADPNTRQQAANALAQALRQIESAICV